MENQKHKSLAVLFFFIVLLVLLLAAGCSLQTLDAPTESPSTVIPSIAAVLATNTPTLTPTTTAITQTSTPSLHVSLIAVGDIMLGRAIGDMINTYGPEIPFNDTAELLSSADITVGNLECAISEGGRAEEKTYTFRAPLAAADSLVLAGFDLLSLANNHILDYGLEAFKDTLDTLQSKQITVVGAGMDSLAARSPVIIERNGLRLAFLAYLDIPLWNYDYLTWVARPDKPGIAWGYRYNIAADVAEATKSADLVIVLLHFGIEGQPHPSQQQIDTAHTAIDAGAALVIGHHTHLLQTIETYNNGLIIYSLGNFVFDEFVEPENQTAILEVQLSPQGVENYQLIPVVIQENGLPEIVEP